MNSCTPTRRRLSAYLDGELDPTGRGEVEAHLLACERCRKLKGELSAADSWLLSAPVPEPTVADTAAFLNRLHKKLDVRCPQPVSLPAASPRSRFSIALPWAFAGFAAMALLVVVPGLHRSSSPEPRMELASARRAGPSGAGPSAAGDVTGAPAALEEASGTRKNEARVASVAVPSPAASARPASHDPLVATQAQLAKLEEQIRELERSVVTFTAQARLESQARTQEFASRRFVPWRDLEPSR
ncbi:MAG: zf-HC2 domain-containing protein [Candidatus Riflebacteria bacterium]|nr:zf-HC2 domain-containing protein [Candidatus Riflebacteria bacterium]